MSKGKVADSRRSTAAQFFMDEEEQIEHKSTYDRVVELINKSIISNNQKLQSLKQVQELIIHKEPALLDNFLDEMLGFQNDKEVDIRKFVVGFIEEACKKDPEILPKVVANLNMMLVDQSVIVQKRVIQASIQLYKVAFRWLCKSKIAVDVMESIWAYLEQLKLGIISLLESDNDGVRTQAVKFMEMLVIVQTYPDQDSPKKGENDVALDDIPGGMKVLRPRKLEEEAKQIFESLVIFHGTPHISSVNLMACMQSLTLIARQRSEFMGKVIQALESLHANLPPTLAKSQVSSVRKHLKLQLLLLLKHPAAVDFQSQIATLLADLGATQQEIMKNLPKPEELKKRSHISEENLPSSKRIKIEKEIPVDHEEEDVPPPPPPSTSRSLTSTAIDITANDILPKLTPLNVADLALISMLSLPPTMPAHFQASYTPISVAGTESQVKHLARLIATQLTAVGLGKGVEEMAANPPTDAYEEEEEEEDEASPQHSIGTILGGTVARDTKKEKAPICLLPTGLTSKPRRMHLNLQEVTKPLDVTQFTAMVAGAVDRIMESDKKVNVGSVNQIRTKVLIGLASQFRGQISEMLRNYIFDDLRNRVDLAISWLFEEYVTYQGFSKLNPSSAKSSLEHYDECLILLLEDLLQKADQKERDILLTRFYLEAPCITENAISLLKTYCQEEATLEHGLSTIKVVIEKRPPKQKTFLHILFDLTLHEKQEVRTHAVRTAKLLYERKDLQSFIEEFALKCLTHLLDPTPPEILTGASGQKVWNEDYSKICLQLYLALLPLNHKLIHDLATVYVGTVADIKRTILRVLENPVKGMGMNSPEMLLLVENCPKGAETLVTRIIHILTDKAPPSAELVARVRDLYHKRVPDVRFLIPVLNGLTKKEVVAALPKLIKLNPIVVKEVFNRLLGSHAESGTTYTSPVTPAELLIALHNIDPSKCDMKTIIKATSLCFAEKQIYTQEVLAVVMQQLMEQNPLPTLLMRTVIQSLSLYPWLLGFVMNILQRLIVKQVWRQKKVWEGFIKCCQRTKPQSFQVLLQLPPPQLKNVFETCSDLRDPLLQHVNAFTENQKAHLPQAIMDVLNGVEDKVAEEKSVSVKIDVDPPAVTEPTDPSHSIPPNKDIKADPMEDDNDVKEP